MPWELNPEFENADFEYSSERGYFVPTPSYLKRNWSKSWWFYHWRMMAVHRDNWENEMRKQFAE